MKNKIISLPNSEITDVLSKYINNIDGMKTLKLGKGIHFSDENGWLSRKSKFERIIDGLITEFPFKIVKGQEDLFGFMLKELLKNAFDSVKSYYDPLLISDDVQLSHRGKIEVKFMVVNMNESSCLRVVVRDNGRGLDAPDTEYKLKHKKKHGYNYYFGGRGLGLQRSEHSIKAIGGDLLLDLLGSKIQNLDITRAILVIPIENFERK